MARQISVNKASAMSMRPAFIFLFLAAISIGSVCRESEWLRHFTSGDSDASVSASASVSVPASVPATTEADNEGDAEHLGGLSDIVANLSSSSSSSSSSSHRLPKLLYLHVGKTGGISLDVILRSNCYYHGNKHRRKKCLEDMLGGTQDDDELLLSKITQHTFHVGYLKPALSPENKPKFKHLWTIRNPISRAVSAFDVANVANQKKKHSLMSGVFYQNCEFRTAQDLANELEFHTNSSSTNNSNASIPNNSNHHHNLITVQNNVTVDCHKFGKDTLEGNPNGLKSHLHFNYAYYARYANKMDPKTGNFVLRTEHLWDDVIQTNGLLMREEEEEAISSSYSVHNSERKTNDDAWMSKMKNISGHRETHGSENHMIKSTLTPRGKEIFCCHLSNENQIYENLLRSAVNLSEKQKEQSLKELYQDCGIIIINSQSPSRWKATSATNVGSSSTTWASIQSSGGFGWEEWRSKGCPIVKISD